LNKDEDQQTIYADDDHAPTVSLHQEKTKKAPHALKSLMNSISNSKSKLNKIFDNEMLMIDD
jgi:hypothetical protein